jgi:DNA-binding response OmpR family regulator
MKVLIIDDEQLLLEDMELILEFEGFDPITAENGRIGVQMAQKHMPDVILCDIAMPQMDGFQVVRELRKQPQTATIPFIFLSALASKTDIESGLEIGANGYLVKPIDAGDLVNAIRSCVR